MPSILGTLGDALFKLVSPHLSDPDDLELLHESILYHLNEVFSAVLLPVSIFIQLNGTTAIPVLESLSARRIRIVLVARTDEERHIATQSIASADILDATLTHEGGDYADILRSYCEVHGIQTKKVACIFRYKDAVTLRTIRAVNAQLGITLRARSFVIQTGRGALIERVREGLCIVSLKRLDSVPAIMMLLDNLLFEPQVNLRETARLLSNGEIIKAFRSLSLRAQQNLDMGKRAIKTKFDLFDQPVYDHRSGAICFAPHEWSYLGDHPHPLSVKLWHYFDEKHEHYWQPDRPCQRRILYTPTKVLLRGETYYTHMKNISPPSRIEEMLVELEVISRLQDDLRELALGLDSIPASDKLSLWKLAMAFLDQVRNIALQLFAFVNAVGRMLVLDPTRSTSELSNLVNVAHNPRDSTLCQLVRYAVRSYYSMLHGDSIESTRLFLRALGCSNTLSPAIRGIAATLPAWLTNEASIDQRKLIPELVRRWREADHPGENLITCSLACKDVEPGKSITAIGIGWGGIELPLLLEYLCEQKHLAASAYIASWSHYRATSETVCWICFPPADKTINFTSADILYILDDNTTTGITIEKIRDQAMLGGAKSIGIYVTRYSGERRLHHMLMKDHGVIDPGYMLEKVGGYIGETAFSRSWSRKPGQYKSQIGVFSLGRRRILECIHNNSTAESWDREGF